MSYNTTTRVGIAELTGGEPNTVWWKVDGNNAAFPTRAIHLDIRNIDAASWAENSIEITAEYFIITPDIDCTITYSGLHLT